MFCPIVIALFICKWALFVNILMFGVIVLAGTGTVWGICWINLLKTVVVLVINSHLPECQMYVKKSDYFASLLLVCFSICDIQYFKFLSPSQSVLFLISLSYDKHYLLQSLKVNNATLGIILTTTGNRFF